MYRHEVKMYSLSPLDQKLLALLSDDSRASISHLAKQLGVTRLTVQSHMETLERKKVIQGYTIRWHPEYAAHLIEALILIATDQKQIEKIVNALQGFKIIHSLSSISGEFDLVAELKASSTQELDAVMDEMAKIDGVLRTQTSVLLSKKFER